MPRWLLPATAVLMGVAQEAVRILGKAVNFARLGLAALYGRPLPETAPAPRDPPEQTVSPGTF